MQEKGVEGKNKIKDRFNELSKQVTIDTSAFINALLKKKEMKKLDTSENLDESEEIVYTNKILLNNLDEESK